MRVCDLHAPRKFTRLPTRAHLLQLSVTNNVKLFGPPAPSGQSDTTHSAPPSLSFGTQVQAACEASRDLQVSRRGLRPSCWSIGSDDTSCILSCWLCIEAEPNADTHRGETTSINTTREISAASSRGCHSCMACGHVSKPGLPRVGSQLPHWISPCTRGGCSKEQRTQRKQFPKQGRSVTCKGELFTHEKKRGLRQTASDRHQSIPFPYTVHPHPKALVPALGKSYKSLDVIPSSPLESLLFRVLPCLLRKYAEILPVGRQGLVCLQTVHLHVPSTNVQSRSVDPVNI